ncbi:MAG: 4Fe-4S dicluster domain-containing protein [Vicinamibacteria bacterium]|jgi:ferredoxin|nr:4Fe-4S dicluster domain-containing protein [Vicinamibacteria bacterium]
MKARLVARQDVLGIVDLLQSEYEVVAPFYGSGRDTGFDIVTPENRDAIQLHLPNPYYPPKRYVFPQLQRMLRYSTGAKPAIEETCESKKRAIFGIRSCDIAGIAQLDLKFLGEQYRDPYYERLRADLFLVNVVCTDEHLDVDEDCFCVCADTGPAARANFDLQLMDLGDHWMAVAGSAKGAALFDAPIFKPGTAADVEKRRAILTKVRQSFKKATSWYSATMHFITTGQVTDEAWEAVGRRCLECGGCSYVCPTCNCFTVTERNVSDKQVERVRMWDACALSGFTRMAGGHNPRKAIHDRRNRRFFRKLAHYYIQRQLSVLCVGCGRCVNVCHGDIGMPSVVEILRQQSAEKAKR